MQPYNLLDYFQQIYIINLAARADRRQEMQTQLQNIGLSVDDPRIVFFTAVRPDDAGEFGSIGARGCFLSHLGVLKDARLRGLDRILIFEDDLNFSSDFLLRISAIIRSLENLSWAVFYGGYQALSPPDTLQNSELVIVPSDMAIQTTHFIGFRQPAINRLIDYLETMLTRPGGDPDGGPMHVDGAYCWFRRANPDMGTLATVPELGFQRSSRTDVHTLRWYDRWAGVRTLTRLARAAKNQFNKTI